MNSPLRINEVIIEPFMVAQMADPTRPAGGVIKQLTANQVTSAERAVLACSEAAQKAIKDGEKEGLPQKEIRWRAKMAYKITIPQMNTTDNVIDAITCITSGYLAGMIDGPEMSKLLYGAQVAQSLLRGGGR